MLTISNLRASGLGDPGVHVAAGHLLVHLPQKLTNINVQDTGKAGQVAR